ncbi:SpaA isopeptide-forming pilin-related protein [Actinotignum sp. GS-2025c]|uniref:SpaA isopeptide-forming pilin-related protein n=1 Tax=Actinotignum sp. GS-2025c TaxID=3427276 RepID=UPI003F44B39C
MKHRKLWGFFASLISGAIVLAGIAIPTASAANDISGLVDQSSIGMNRNSNLTVNSHIGTTTEVSATTGWAGTLKFKLAKKGAHPSVNAGDVLKVGLTPVDPALDLLRISGNFNSVTQITDSVTGAKLADVATEAGHIGVFTFTDVSEDFVTSQIEMPFYVDKGVRDRYFEGNLDAAHVDVAYDITVNGKPTGKKVTYRVKKPVVKLPDMASLEKTGASKVDGDKSYIYSEIQVGTRLRPNNEFIIYDTPDVNMAPRGNVTVYDEKTQGGKDSFLAELGATNPHWVKDSTKPEEQRMEMWLYDIYFRTTEPETPVSSRTAAFEEKSITLDRYDIVAKKQGMMSMANATVPKDILLQKPAGETLTAEEQKLIDDAGGLHKVVGKGFMLRVKNYSSAYFDGGGYFNIGFDAEPVNDSVMLSKNGRPIYVNKASYYAQEIPNCDPQVHQNCTPIKYEGSKPGDVEAKGKGYNPEELKPPGITAETDGYQLIDFVKQDDTGRALSGAVFSIYKAKSDGTPGDIATNRDGVKLEDLVSGADGKLYLPDRTTGVKLELKRGNYVFVEVKAPEGFGKAKNTIVPVQFKQKVVVVSNTKVKNPGNKPSVEPSVKPSIDPSSGPSVEPSNTPSPSPSGSPSVEPSATPSVEPSGDPSVEPSADPSIDPSSGPSVEPTGDPSVEPSITPSAEPSGTSSVKPTPNIKKVEKPNKKLPATGFEGGLIIAVIAVFGTGIALYRKAEAN